MFTDARIESIMYQVTFNPKTREGDIIVNLSTVDKRSLEDVLEIFRQVMYSGLSVCSYVHVFDEGEVWYAADAIPNGTAAAIALIEHRWAIPLRDTIAGAGGFVLADEWIHPQDLVAVGLMAAAEAEAAKA